MSSGEDALKYNNLGYCYKNISRKDESEDERTLIVTGLGRSGTTMLARIVESAGIFMGEAFHAEKNVMREDLDLSIAIENHNIESVKEIVAKRNSRFKVWGMKRPMIFERRSVLERYFRNPRYLIMFRDPLAVGVRNQISLEFTLEDSLHVYQKQLEENIQFIRASNAPMLLISYEKMLTNPKPILDEIMWFCGVSNFDVQKALSLILPDDPSYINEARPA